MSAATEELTLEVVFVEEIAEAAIREQAEAAIMAQNCEAMSVEAESFAVFVDLLSGADQDYLTAEEYAEPVVMEAEAPAVDWAEISRALSESQAVMIGVQQLLSETFAAMGVEDHEFIRVMADLDGSLRLLADHPRREEIEAVLNSPENNELRSMYDAAMAGMGLAGNLVGAVADPAKVLEQVKRAKALAVA